ncbi:MAG: HAMP domain-containing histidine kinase [Actinomycetales bacterium]|nr:HAMP domain-containing histidine kinase [Tetrasphaera sp.]NLW98532.1 HAMP domain-containing histidine kinase [Actinomycetales bacterium]
MPLQVRLIAILLVLLLLTVSLTTAATAVLLKRDLTARIDAELQAASRPIVSQALQDMRATGSMRIPTGYSLIIMTPDGDPILTIDSTVVNGHPDVAPITIDDPNVRSGRPFTVNSGPGQPDWRMVAGLLADGQATFALGMPLTSVSQTVQRMVAVASLFGLAAILTAAATGFYAVRRAFRPLREIEDTAEAIAGGDLARRIPPHAADDEVASLSRSLNAMLAQIEASFAAREKSEDRMRQFVADASHELRTPLATVRGYAELYRQGAIPTTEALDAAMGRIESEASRMSRLVEDLLTLARLDETPVLTVGPIDLTVLAGDAVADAQVREPSRRITLHGLDGPITPVHALGDEGAMRQVLANLIANAVHHTPEGTPIDLAVGYRDDMAVLEVRDHGPGIPRAEAEKVFQRFYRADPSRGRTGESGNGLGLAIVSALATHQRGRVGVAQTPGGGATFVVQIPRAPVSPGHPDDTADDPDDADTQSE